MTPMQRAIVVASQARRTFGDEVQDRKIVEECAEVLEALVKHRSGRTDLRHVREEAADAMLTLLGLPFEDGLPDFERLLSEKADRLIRLIEQKEKNK